MQIIEVNDREKLSTLIIQELKDIGVKYRKDKKTKQSQEKTCRKRIFRTHLHLLELTDVILASGSVVQIPRFVADACNRILEQVETEGLFRKAGSSLRQKEIRLSLEAGLPLGKTHHVIDVANVVKSFFRELPEPLLPSYIQETLLRSLLIGDNRIKAILLSILLLPPLTINTLSFFMQFLNTVSLYSHMNKMPVENLAIIFTPGLMPFPDIASLRFNNHVKMVQLLIENAHAIGTVPECIVDKLHVHEIYSKTPSKSKSVEALDMKKKKKRRSGSLTQMFNGLRKMVGAIGSAENLGHTPECSKTPLPAAMPTIATPCLSKSSKKRKFAEPVCAFSAKKKKDLLALLPSNSGGFLPNTPLVKEPKKTRLSLGGRRHAKKSPQTAPAMPSMERRWSIVGSGWPRNKKDKKEASSTITKPLSPVASMPCISKFDFPKVEFAAVEQASFIDSSVPDSTTDFEKNSSESSDADFVRVPKNYYESIIERVSAIETRMSQEFGKIHNSLSSGDDLDLSIKKAQFSNDERMDCSMTGLERVLNEYEQTKEETERLTSPYTDNLAKRLSRELKIRRSSENRIIRSPSARKIGTMRRRSREAARLTRNKTWHDSSTSEKPMKPVILYPPTASVGFCSKCNLKRGRPNTLNTGLPQQCTPIDEKKTTCGGSRSHSLADEQWTAGEVFFDAKSSNSQAPSSAHGMEHKPLEECVPSTPVTTKVVPLTEMKTPMLPPRSIPKKVIASSRTQGSALRLVPTRILTTPGDDEVNGRASIARLRAQNAGMVMAKAKLFDGLGNNENEAPTVFTPTTTNRRRSVRLPAAPLHLKTKFNEEKSLPTTNESPSVNKKNNTKSPGCIQKRQRLCLASKVPSKQFLDSMVNEDSLLSKKAPINASFKKISNNDRAMNSPRTPKNRNNHFGGVNSPRRGRNPNSANGSRRRTPLKANTPGKKRQSPRFVKAAGRT